MTSRCQRQQQTRRPFMSRDLIKQRGALLKHFSKSRETDRNVRVEEACTGTLSSSVNIGSAHTRARTHTYKRGTFWVQGCMREKKHLFTKPDSNTLRVWSPAAAEWGSWWWRTNFKMLISPYSLKIWRNNLILQVKHNYGCGFYSDCRGCDIRMWIRDHGRKFRAESIVYQNRTRQQRTGPPSNQEPHVGQIFLSSYPNQQFLPRIWWNCQFLLASVGLLLLQHVLQKR